MLHDMLIMDETLKAIYDLVKDDEETLILVTGDHETGGFGFNYQKTDLPEAQ